MNRRLLSLLLIAGTGIVVGAFAAAPVPVDLGVEAEQFEFPGSWVVNETPPASDGKFLISGEERALPAATTLQIPRAGRYHLWVRAVDFPDDRPGTRTFSVALGGRAAPGRFGRSGRAGYTWERGGVFDLAAGPLLVALTAHAAFARADALFLTTDPDFVPAQPLGGSGRLRRTAPLVTPGVALPDPLASVAVTDIAAAPVAQLANGFVRIAFVRATRGGRPAVVPRIALKTGDTWRDVPADPAGEIYAVVDAGADVKLNHAGFFPRWQSSRHQVATITATAGGVSVQTARPLPGAIWEAGALARFVPHGATNERGRVQLEFAASPLGQLSAEWELRPGERAARVRMKFVPVAGGQFALGYHLFFRRPLEVVEEILLPMMWHRRRLPVQPRLLLDPMMPTPVALAATGRGADAQAWAVIGEPERIPFAWPQPSDPHFGLVIRDHAGAVQPAIYGPVPGTKAAARRAGEPVELAFRVLVQPGDWYAGFRTAADEVCGLRDYRRNVGTSLTEAALNMIDLLKDDDHGGWWERGKGFYQIETKNGVTHASPLTLLSLYRITGDTELYRRRTLPTMEYVLSRRSPHFSPLPHDTGRYDAGGMDGPVKLFGTATFSGLWEMSGRHTDAFRAIALPGDGVRPTAGYSHVQPFDDWLARYQATGDPAALQKARALADDYLAKHIQRAPTAELGTPPFFFISFVPDWEGLLRLYEVTQEPRYLDVAAFGARQLMTGLWTQPLIPAGEVTIHPDGQFKGDVMGSWRGAGPFRLGTPRRANDTPAHAVPAWVVSNVGLGFEQPITYKGSGPGRLIYQMGWAPDFLRLARYTGDAAFETCARNAVLGRWANYPGYYATGFTDLPLDPRYPLKGPDVTDIYYHHIAPHLAWTLDYLVAEAETRSAGRIAFPSQRQNGYAYFDARLYGHAPGKIEQQDNVWLWLRRGLVTLDNPQLNYLTARTASQFFLILMNESDRAERSAVRVAAAELGLAATGEYRFTPLLAAADAPRPVLRDGATEVVVPARGLLVLQLDDTRTEVPTHRRFAAPQPGSAPAFATTRTTEPGIAAQAAALQVGPGAWDAYVWCTASADQARSVTLRYTVGGVTRTIVDEEYPFEFSVPVADPRAVFRYTVDGTTPAGKTFHTSEATIAPLSAATP